MAESDYILKFYHNGEFTKTKFLGGTCTEIPELVDADKFSYTVVMEYVKDDLKYTEIGGVYVKKVPHGWRLIADDTDLTEFILAVQGVNLDFYIDNVVDKSIEPRAQMQPHVIVRPRTNFFEGLAAKRQFVTLNGLQKKRENNRLAGKSAEFGSIKGKSAKIIPKDIPDYERKRLLRKQQNDEMLESLRIKKLAAAIVPQKDKEKVEDGDSSLEFDREYVPGHDSLSEVEKEEEEMRSKQVMEKKKIKRNRHVKTMTKTDGPRTRSRAATPSFTQIPSPGQSLTAGQKNAAPPSTQNAPPPTINAPPYGTDCLPPPPRITDDLPPSLPLTMPAPQKVRNNEGIGSMEAFLQMRKRQKDSAFENKHVDEGTGQTPNSNTHEETLEIPTGAPQIKKRRGPTLMNSVYTRRPEEKKIIRLNSEFQCVADDDRVLSEFSNFLGTLARQAVPLDYTNWHKYPQQQRDELWNYVKTKYEIPEEAKTYTLRTINALWRVHKSRVKKDHYLKYDNDEERLRNKPSVVSAEEFKVLLKYWGDEEIKRRSKTASDNRQKIVETHTAGRTSFAQIGEKIKVEEKIQEEEPVPLELIYVKTHKRKPGHKYKTQIPTDDDEDSLAEDGVEDGSSAANNSAQSKNKIKNPAHGPNWLLGRSGKSRKTKINPPLVNHSSKCSSSSANVADLKKTIREELVAEMQDIIDKKVRDKLTTVIGRLGEIVPDLREVAVEELCAVVDEGKEAENDQ